MVVADCAATTRRANWQLSIEPLSDRHRDVAFAPRWNPIVTVPVTGVQVLTIDANLRAAPAMQTGGRIEWIVWNLQRQAS